MPTLDTSIEFTRIRAAQTLVVSLLAAAFLLSGCATPLVQDVVERASPKVPSERRAELRVTAFLADASDRRAMRSADDVGAWLDAYWTAHDPTPGTPENEALALYMERSEWLQQRFPDIPFGEWREPWGLFLRCGLPDSRGPEFVSGWERQNDAGHSRTPPSSDSGFLRERITFGTPEVFTLIVREGAIQQIPGTPLPPGAPSLEGDWDLIEGPSTSVIDKRQALIDLSWYEHPDVACRLLALPESRWFNVPDMRRPIMTRMAVRGAYRLGTDGARRLAALRAAGAPPDLLLRRSIAGSYPAELFARDLAPLAERRLRLERGSERGPHPRLWRDPEAVLTDLARSYPDPDRITGWDWRGDVNLALGPPAYLDEKTRIAYLLWSTPDVVGIGDTMLGWCQTQQLRDDLKEFLPESQNETRRRRDQGDRASQTVADILSSGEGAPSGGGRALLENLGVLAPPNVYRVGLPDRTQGGPVERRSLPMTMDAVAFPAGKDSVEIQVSFGLPTSEVTIRQLGDGRYATDLRVSLVLMDDDLRLKWGTTRQEGYLIEGGDNLAGRFFLDTFRFTVPVGSYITYLSAQDPDNGKAGGLLEYLDLVPLGSSELQVSPILLATDIGPAQGAGKFVRGDERILPAPSRMFFYGQDLFFHFEVSNLTRSDVGDYVWTEKFYIIPDDPSEGIVTLGSTQDRTSLEPRGNSSIQIDLSNMENTYEGPVYLVLLVTDSVSGEQAVGATRLSLRRRP